MANYYDLDFHTDNDGHLTLSYEDSLTGEFDMTLKLINGTWYRQTWTDDSDDPTLTPVVLADELRDLLAGLSRQADEFYGKG